MRSTTILAVKRGGQVAIAGDGQITVGDMVLKHTAKKLRTLYHDQVIAGFAGAVADTLTLFLQTDAGDFGRPGEDSARQSDLVVRGEPLVAPRALVAVDLDGDADVDLASANSGADNLSLHFQVEPGVSPRGTRGCCVRAARRHSWLQTSMETGISIWSPATKETPKHGKAATCSSSLVFMTIGPYQATGSRIGFPEISKKRTCSSSVVTTTSSPSLKRMTFLRPHIFVISTSKNASPSKT